MVIDKIQINSIEYNIKDSSAQQALNGLAFGTNSEGSRGFIAPGTSTVVPFGSGSSSENNIEIVSLESFDNPVYIERSDIEPTQPIINNVLVVDGYEEIVSNG